MSDEISVNVKSSGDNKYTVTLSSEMSILDVKKLVAQVSNVPAERQRLIYSGKILKDTEFVKTYNIKLGDTIHLVKSAAPKPASAASADPSSATTSAAPTSNIPSTIAAGQGAYNPLAGLTGARYAGYTQLPLASMFGPDGGMNQTFDPESLGEMMSNPMFQQSMNAMLSDPQMMDYVIEQNPQLRAMGPQAREMMQSPFFRQMISNPEVMRQMMSMSGAMGGAPAAFPAPGTNPNLGDPSAPASDLAASPAAPGNPAAAAANPFASLFPGGMPPMSALASMMGGNPAAAGAAAAPAPQDTRPPEERYEQQLRQLNDMGFFDFDANVAALRRTGGSVQGAIEQLLNN